MSRIRNKKVLRWASLFGLFGFAGFGYFISHNPAVLSYFSFFSFFSYFFLEKIDSEMVDERYLENERKARNLAFKVPLAGLVIVWLLAMTSFYSKELLIAISTLSYSTTLLVYAISFYHFENK
ncbi:MAG: DUF3796 domain-containing protein [Anaerolineaceae bacterium]